MMFDADHGTAPGEVDACLVQMDDALRAAARRYYAGHGPSDPALHAAVCAAVDALRADGRDVVTVLRTVRDRLAGRGGAPCRLLDDAVRWCIARYYDPVARPMPDRPAARS